MLFQLFFAQCNANRSAVGAVFQILTGHNLPNKSQNFLFVGGPASLDGGLAGYGVENFIPYIVHIFFFAHQKICGDGFDGIAGIFFFQIHRDLPQNHGIFAQRVQLKAQLLHQLPIGKENPTAGRIQMAGNRNKQILGGNGLLIGLQLIRESARGRRVYQ